MTLKLTSDILENSTKKVYRQNLDTQQVLIDKFISTSTHDPYFVIKQLPEIFGSGKNLIYIDSNNSNLEKNTPVNIEIIDSNNNPVYYEILDVINKDFSRVISVTINSDTPKGNGVLYITGIALRYENGIIIDKPQLDRKVRYKIPIYINPDERNTSPILFSTKPTISIKETIIGLESTDLITDTNFIQTSGSIQYEYRNNNPYLISHGFDFIPDMVGSEIRIELNNPLPSTSSIIDGFEVSNYTSFTGSIKSIIDASSALLEQPIQIKDSIRNKTILFTKTDNSSYNILYTGSKTTDSTHNSQSYAVIEMSDISPSTGDIYKLRTFQKQKAMRNGNYQIISETDVKASPLFFNPNDNNLANDLGYIKDKTHIDSFYTLETYNSTPIGVNTLETGSNLNNSMKINYSSSFGDGEYLGIRLKSNYFLSKLSSGNYDFSFNVIGTVDSNNTGNPKIRVDLKSSDDSNFNKTIFQNEQQEDFQKHGILKSSFSLNTSLTNVYYIIWMEQGNWEVSDIKFNSKYEFGFTPSFTRHIVPVKTEHRNDEIDFKFEFVNQNGDSSPLSIEIPKLNFTGSNTYISGEDNVLNGKMSLSSIPGKGILFERPCKEVPTGLIKSPQFTSFDKMVTDFTGSIETTGGFMMISSSGSNLTNCRDDLTGSNYSNNTSFDMITDNGNYLKYRGHGSEQELSLIESHRPQTIHTNPTLYSMNSDTPSTYGSFMMEKNKLVNYIVVLGRWYVSSGEIGNEPSTFKLDIELISSSSNTGSSPIILTDQLVFGDGVNVGANKQLLTATTFSIDIVPDDSLLKVNYTLQKNSIGGTKNANMSDLIFYSCHKSQIKRLQQLYPFKPDI